MLNPFDTVYDIKKGEDRSYYKLLPLFIDDRVFPEHNVDLNIDRQNDYRQLWNAFEEEVKRLPNNHFTSQATSLLNLLKKYTWCIPSATNSMPDISLYDHLKTTAAIATCLYQSTEIEEFGSLPVSFDGLIQEEKERFVLLAGDFSGIQKFIYQLSSKGAAKTLKGRSFYLSLVQDVVIQKIKNIFEAEDAQILMSSGGRFQILLPNDSSKIELFKEFISKINLELRKEFESVLYLAIGIKAFRASQLLKDNGYSEAVKDAYKEVERDKNRKFAEVIDEQFFMLGEVSGTKSAQICHVTGIDLQDNQVAELVEEDMIISKSVEEQISLGRWLRDAKYIVKIQKSTGKKKNHEITPLSNFVSESDEDAITYRFCKSLTKEELKRMTKSEPVSDVIAINNTDFMSFSETGQHFSSSFMFYGAAWTPDEVSDEDKKEPKTVEFTDIAKDNANNLMAVVRLDIDSLGDLFRNGFNTSDSTNKYLGSISRYSNMSEKLDLFFSGYIHYLISEIYKSEKEFDQQLLSGSFTEDQPCQHIFPVYAGGDDVFIICRWDIAPQLAKRIHDDFKRFVNHHDKLSLSGGISVVSGKYPIHKAALEADEAEKKAKSLKKSEKADGKDALCMFGQAMSWKDFSLAESYVKQIITWQEQMKSRTILSFLRNLYAEYDDRFHFGRWRWRSAYQLKRIGKAYKNEEDMARFASWLFTGNLDNEGPERVEILKKNKEQKEQRNPELVDLTGFAVRWVQNLTRNKS